MKQLDISHEAKAMPDLYIPPYKLAQMMEIATKALKLITSNSTFTFGYYDCRKIINIMLKSIDEVFPEEAQKNAIDLAMKESEVE